MYGYWSLFTHNTSPINELPRGSLVNHLNVHIPNARPCTVARIDSRVAPLTILGIHSLQLLHGLVPLPSTPIQKRPPERLDKVLIALMAVVGQGDDLIGSTSGPDHGKDLELFVLLPQTRVELACAVETPVLSFLDVPHGDFAVKCVEVNEGADV
jgi:hypothetical protein